LVGQSIGYLTDRSPVRRDFEVDTKAIAKEIVEIRHRLDELADHHDAGYTREQSELRDRLRHLQNMLSSKVARDAPQDSPAEPDSVHYHPPA
jgi:hypothetical protein